MNLKYRVWIASNDDEKVFGYGIYQLLRYVRILGSLSKACHAMKIPYQKASMIIDRCEKHFDEKIIIRTSGGAGGGGSEISAFGQGLMNRYEAFVEEADLALRNLYNVHFDVLNNNEEN